MKQEGSIGSKGGPAAILGGLLLLFEGDVVVVE